MKKFKFTWGHAMVLVLLSFIIFILSFLVRMQMNRGNSMDLVTEDYYNYGLNYQERYDASQNVYKLKNPPTIDKIEGQLVVKFPDSIQVHEGELNIYRPSDKTLDLRFPLQLQNHQMVVKNEAFKRGKYQIQLYWKDDQNTPYLMKKDMTWP